MLAHLLRETLRRRATHTEFRKRLDSAEGRRRADGVFHENRPRNSGVKKIGANDELERMLLRQAFKIINSRAALAREFKSRAKFLRGKVCRHTRCEPMFAFVHRAGGRVGKGESM
jgi:hypothetical protein